MLKRIRMRAALYTRVSTQHKGQETTNQLLQLRECCQAQNWSIVGEYEDHESEGKSERSIFQQMLRDAAARKFDVLFFWSLDRLTREGTLATLKYLELLETYGVRWRSLTEPWIDSAGPFRDVIISLLASLAKARTSLDIRTSSRRANSGETIWNSERKSHRQAASDLSTRSGNRAPKTGTLMATDWRKNRCKPIHYSENLSEPKGELIPHSGWAAILSITAD